MTRKRRVLVVEDEVTLLAGIREILELENYLVLTAKDGLDGLTVLQSDPNNPPDVIISDVMMPRMSGFEFLEEVRKEDRWVTVPFIFLTARSERVDRNTGDRLGADVYLTKPFDPAELIVAVESKIARLENIRRVKDTEMKDQKRKILTILNHEFRTPLTLVVAYAEMLKEFDPSGMDESEVMTYLHGVNEGADRLRRIVENFITLVELDTGEAHKTIQWRKRPVEDISLIIEDSKRQVDVPLQRSTHFDLEIEPNLPAVYIDVQYITAVIRELLHNAAKFTADGGQVQVRATAIGTHLEISIQDDGRGIPADEIEKIWTPFYQIDRETHEDQGTGSGLAIVDGLITLHGGTRSVESTPGKGSTFTIRLPLGTPIE